jgi:membrane-bound lytic murein transglycosylase D
VATRSADRSPISKLFKIAALGFALAPFLCWQMAAAEATDPFVHPPGLERDVRFWIRVYTEVTTDQGLLHDDWNLELVYEVLRFDPAASPAQRERRVAEAKAHYASLLRRFAAAAAAGAAVPDTAAPDTAAPDTAVPDTATPGAATPGAATPGTATPDTATPGAATPDTATPGATAALTAHERRIRHAFGDKPTPAQFIDAIDRIRFQLGQADRFHEGLIRAAAWESHIVRVLEQHGVPAELAALPHVESSFDPAAYSKVGAAGLWQFMPSTAKRFMRVDSVVDERLDPESATEAAANLMLYNYRLLGSWPLAVTAYNHGPGGLRRAQEQLGTSDIAVIVKRYQGATFGFASRNFYVAFLAALEVDRNAEKYFGPITQLPDTQSTPVELPDYIAVEALAKAFKIDMGALRVLNPALRPPVWNGTRLVPRGYALRIPGTPPLAEITAAWARLPPSQRYVAQRNDGNHKVRRGETLAAVAAASGVSVARLLAANGWPSPHELARGELVHIPMPASRAEISGAASPPVLAASAAPATTSGVAKPDATTPSAPPQPSGASEAMIVPGSDISEKTPTAPKEPVSARQTESAALLPVEAPTGGADATDYSVGSGDTVIVQAAETLGHFADWTRVDAQSLRALNKLHKNAMVTLGRKIKLDLSRVTAAQFVAARRDYHRQLQEEFFATHRIAGSENYSVRRGESLWTIAQHSDLPVWLVAQYNPDVDFDEVRPGTSIALPRVASINRQ